MPIKDRLNWIDWMKVFGMYFIVLGHLFSVGMVYVYVFSVPLFFIISGYLTKRQEDNHVFWKKAWYNFVVPLLLISVICLFLDSIIALIFGKFDVDYIYKFPFELVLGFKNATRNLWFVYTLVIIKVIYQFAHSSRRWLNFCMQGLLLLGFPLLGFLISKSCFQLGGHDLLHMPNSYINVCLAYPYFMVGTYMRRYQETLNAKHGLKVEAMVFIVMLGVVITCGLLNGPVMMYANNYGNNIFLFYLGGFCGTIMIYQLCKWLDGIHLHWVTDISKGCILILGFQWYLLDVVYKFRPGVTLLDWGFSVLVIAAFVPFIRLVEKYCPLLMGKYRIE